MQISTGPTDYQTWTNNGYNNFLRLDSADDAPWLELKVNKF